MTPTHSRKTSRLKKAGAGAEKKGGVQKEPVGFGDSELPEATLTTLTQIYLNTDDVGMDRQDSKEDDAPLEKSEHRAACRTRVAEATGGAHGFIGDAGHHRTSPS